MIFAYNENGEKIEAFPNALGFCPVCAERLIARCGLLRIPHWSHLGIRDCDAWHEPETIWHLEWKRLFGKENCEIVKPPHRADILGNFNVIIALQHSAISVEEIIRREQFYKKMIWIVDANRFAENLFFQKNSASRTDEKGKSTWSSDERFGWSYSGHAQFLMSWKRKQKRWLPMFGAQMPVLLDLSDIEINAGAGYLHGLED